MSEQQFTGQMFQCLCGSTWFNMICTLGIEEDAEPNDYTPGGWYSDVTCAKCGESYNLARIHMGAAFDDAMRDLPGASEGSSE